MSIDQTKCVKCGLLESAKIHQEETALFPGAHKFVRPRAVGVAPRSGCGVWIFLLVGAAVCGALVWLVRIFS